MGLSKKDIEQNADTLRSIIEAIDSLSPYEDMDEWELLALKRDFERCLRVHVGEEEPRDISDQPPCSKCSGTGHCRRCHGSGVLNRAKRRKKKR